MKVEDLSAEIKEEAKGEIHQKGYFWRKLADVFLDTLLPVILRILLKRYDVTKK